MTCSRPIRLGVLTVFVLGLAAAQAAAWGPGVHAYVADHTGKLWPFLNRIEMYGSMLPDMCYFTQDLGDFPEHCADVIHDEITYTRMWDQAFTLNTRALGFGYESHHEADKTAHEAGVLFGRDEGYVIQKAGELSGPLAAILSRELGFPVDPAIVEPLAHNLVEVGTDVLVKRVNPFIGNKVLMAALLRGSFVPQQLVTVYDPSYLDPVKLTTAEWQFRMAMIAYGLALSEDETQAIGSLAELLVPLAPSWIPLSEEQLIPLIEEAIEGAIALCERDFPLELWATTWAVRVRLWQQGVAY